MFAQYYRTQHDMNAVTCIGCNYMGIISKVTLFIHGRQYGICDKCFRSGQQ